MRNKYVVSRSMNVKYVRQHLDELVANALALSRYDEKDDQRETAEVNFRRAFDYIMEEHEVENDYECMLQLHDILMDGLNDDIRNGLTIQQINELHEMINQPAKANVEIAIDVMLYILDKRLFADGDVRVAIMFANKIMIDNGCGIITIRKDRREAFRTYYREYQETLSDDFKNWIYKYCIRGPKVEY